MKYQRFAQSGSKNTEIRKRLLLCRENINNLKIYIYYFRRRRRGGRLSILDTVTSTSTSRSWRPQRRQTEDIHPPNRPNLLHLSSSFQSPPFHSVFSMNLICSILNFKSYDISVKFSNLFNTICLFIFNPC